MTDDLTKPERACERHLAKIKRAKVTATGGCACCIHRIEAFGLAACSQLGKVFPFCIGSPGKHFEPDHKAIQGMK